VEVELPPGATVAYPADSFALAKHHIWVVTEPPVRRIVALQPR